MPDHPASDLEAWVVAMLQPDTLREATGAALLGAALHNPELLAGVLRRQADQVAALTRLPRKFPLTATMLPVVDGLLFGEIWPTTPCTASQRARIIEQLSSLVDLAFDAQPVLERFSS